MQCLWSTRGLHSPFGDAEGRVSAFMGWKKRNACVLSFMSFILLILSDAQEIWECLAGVARSFGIYTFAWDFGSFPERRVARWTITVLMYRSGLLLCNFYNELGDFILLRQIFVNEFCFDIKVCWNDMCGLKLCSVFLRRFWCYDWTTRDISHASSRVFSSSFSEHSAHLSSYTLQAYALLM